MTDRAIKLRLNETIFRLKKEYPHSTCSLHFESPFQLLIATILSAQCTDKRVNAVTSNLFRKFPGPHDFLGLTVEQIGKEIYSTGFYNNKAKSIKNLTSVIVRSYDGNIPESIEELVKLPGVGRKTANVVLGTAFHKPAIVVDTHVIRISNLLQLVHSTNPVKIAHEFMKIMDKKDWIISNHLYIDHGRKICIARRPRCNMCILNEICPSNQITNKRVV